jgi:hypothetical protein
MMNLATFTLKHITNLRSFATISIYLPQISDSIQEMWYLQETIIVSDVAVTYLFI